MSADQGELRPDFEAVQAHYDTSAPLIRNMIDWEDTRMYSCALWTTGATTLADAERAKDDHTLAKLNLQPGQRLLDTGCGYGHTLRRARELYGVEGVGLTLSDDQFTEARRMAEGIEGLTYLKQGWEEHEGKYDAVVSIGMAEHVGRDKLLPYLEWVREALPERGLFLLHMIFIDRDAMPKDSKERRSFINQVRFLGTDIFPRGYLPTLEQLRGLIQNARFKLLDEEFIGPNYFPTLNAWQTNLEVKRDAAIAAATEDLLRNPNTSPDEAERTAVAMYEMYKTPYLEGTATWFKQGSLNVGQWLLQK